MVTRRAALGLFASAFLPVPVRADDLEPEFLKLRLQDGQLPALADRRSERV